MRKVTGKGLSCVKRVLWSPTRPSVFFVLDELKQSDGKAVTVSHNLQVCSLPALEMIGNTIIVHNQLTEYIDSSCPDLGFAARRRRSHRS